jgi:hypothetical protein
MAGKTIYVAVHKKVNASFAPQYGMAVLHRGLTILQSTWPSVAGCRTGQAGPGKSGAELPVAEWVGAKKGRKNSENCPF